MSYETPLRIADVVESIRTKEYVLPSIQREFVWKPDQIEVLFDSLMRNYPIGTFLFWKVDKSNIKKFRFYEFIREYHEVEARHNPVAEIKDDDGIIAILDGQQRMTSLYLGLKGHYIYKKPYLSKNNPNAYPERHLYLNLLKRSEELEMEYDFQFLTEEDAKNTQEGDCWFKCSKILEFKDKSEIYDFLDDEDLSDTHINPKDRVKFARGTLSRFYDFIHEYGTISYFLEREEDLDNVLQIFIRINSGGTPLSYSDLLLSIATAQWENVDARDIIHKFVDEINKIGNGFKFNKDVVLKSCLVLSGFDVKFKVSNFTKSNMEKIEKNWDRISSSLRVAVNLISKFGYSQENLAATNAIIPIAYFIYRNKFEDQILDSKNRKEDRQAIREWLARVLLKGTFGGTPDSIYPRMRSLVDENLGHFPLKETIDYYKRLSKSISFTSPEIDTLAELQYGNPKTYGALTLLYPDLDHGFRYHQDHIHPRSVFFKKEMKKAKPKFTDEEIEKFGLESDGISNLQLLSEVSNTEKSNTPFKDWLEDVYSEKAERNRYLDFNLIDPEQSLELKDFLDFVEKRKKTIKNRFIKVLGVTNEEQAGE